MLSKIRRITSFVLRLIAGPVLMIDGFSKLDGSLEQFSIISFDMMGLPAWLTGVISFLEFAFGAAILFNLFAMYFALGMTAIMIFLVAMLQMKSQFTFTTLSPGDALGSFGSMQLPAHHMVLPMLLSVLLLLIAMLTTADVKKRRLAKKEKRLVKAQTPAGVPKTSSAHGS